VVAGGSAAEAAVTTASAVVDYQRGNATSFTNPSAGLGLPAGDTSFGALTPFNPPFRDDQIVIVGAGGSLTLRLSSPVETAGGGPEIGVFTNNGLVDVSPNGSGVAGNPAATFSPLPMARVSVSRDGQTFVPLGPEPVVFGNPTNFYTDTSIENYSAPLGMVTADFSGPFDGTLSSFSGRTYAGMLTLLGGSGGGTWLDVSGSGLESVEYVRFDVPAGERLVLDAVTAVPEPAVGVAVVCVPALLARRRGSGR
jgi:hypothetical protein